jgi:predicted ATPase with chaperone activity
MNFRSQYDPRRSQGINSARCTLTIHDIAGVSHPCDFIDPSHTTPEQKPVSVQTDFRDIKGQEHEIRALEVAAAGGHNVFTSGTTVQVL